MLRCHSRATQSAKPKEKAPISTGSSRPAQLVVNPKADRDLVRTETETSSARAMGCHVPDARTFEAVRGVSCAEAQSVKWLNERGDECSPKSKAGKVVPKPRYTLSFITGTMGWHGLQDWDKDEIRRASSGGAIHGSCFGPSPSKSLIPPLPSHSPEISSMQLST